MATSVLGLKTFAASDPVDVNEVNDNYVKIDNGVKTAMQGRAAYNIMDNSYFIKNAFIAQAGVNGTHGSEKYLGDRWIGHASIGASQQNDGIVLTSSTQYAYIKQKVNTVVGKTYTYAINATGISNNHRIAVYDGGMNSAIASTTGDSSNGILLVSFVATTETTCLLYYPGFASSGGTAKIVWAALYEGSYTADTLPAYQPKGYAAELAECMRYFERIGSAESVMLSNTVYAGSGAKAFVFSIKYAPKRLKSPSVTFSDVSNYRVLFQDAVNASVYGALGITAIDDIMAENPYARFRVSISSAINTNSWAMLQRQDGAQNAYIDISADL